MLRSAASSSQLCPPSLLRKSMLGSEPAYTLTSSCLQPRLHVLLTCLLPPHLRAPVFFTATLQPAGFYCPSAPAGGQTAVQTSCEPPKVVRRPEELQLCFYLKSAMLVIEFSG